ncbi:hypothetical protein NMY22_g12904 [Coprinellus aureogranulatus]|nr:hypothetical protein NMY22_g12904 [Coprinellus aureogranulatus]
MSAYSSSDASKRQKHHSSSGRSSVTALPPTPQPSDYGRSPSNPYVQQGHHTSGGSPSTPHQAYGQTAYHPSIGSPSPAGYGIYQNNPLLSSPGQTSSTTPYHLTPVPVAGRVPTPYSLHQPLPQFEEVPYSDDDYSDSDDGSDYGSDSDNCSITTLSTALSDMSLVNLPGRTPAPQVPRVPQPSTAASLHPTVLPTGYPQQTTSGPNVYRVNVLDDYVNKGETILLLRSCVLWNKGGTRLIAMEPHKLRRGQDFTSFPGERFGVPGLHTTIAPKSWATIEGHRIRNHSSKPRVFSTLSRKDWASVYAYVFLERSPKRDRYGKKYRQGKETRRRASNRDHT